MDRKLFTLAVSSFAVHGTASLKTFIKILGHRILPVPSKILNGLTNMALVKPFDPPFEELLTSSLELAVNKNIDLIMYIGYLGREEQADIILAALEKYQDIIKAVIVDPVSGDNGRVYVPETVIRKWPALIKKANIVFPNITELKIHTGHAATENGSSAFYIEKFRERYPDATLVAKSIAADEHSIGVEVAGDVNFAYALPKLAKSYGGSGDLFLSQFILHHYFKLEPFETAIKNAMEETHALISHSVAEGSDDLLLDFATLPLI